MARFLSFGATALTVVRTAWRWWLDGLLLGIPVRWRAALTRVPDRWLIALDDDAIAITWQPATGATREARISRSAPEDGPELMARIRAALDGAALDDAHCIAVLTPSRVLHRSLPLPRQAEHTLRPILGFEIERLTPFTREAVCFSYAVTEIDTAHERLFVALRVALVADVRDLLERLGHLGIHPHAVRLRDQDLALGELPAIRARRAPRTRRARMRLRFALAAAVLLLANLYAPLALHRHRIARLEQDVAALRAQIDARQASLGGSVRTNDQIRFLARQQAVYPPLAALLRELSDRLPDHTFLQQLTIADGKLRLQGQAADAAPLVPLVEESDWFNETAPAAPFNQNPMTNTVSFQIIASVQPATAP